MRRSLGTAVFSGMLGVTLFGIFLTPVFFYVIYGLSETRLFMSAGHAVDRLEFDGRAAGSGDRILAGAARPGRSDWALIAAAAGSARRLVVAGVHWRVELAGT